MTSETPCNDTKARWLAEANSGDAAPVGKVKMFEGRPVADVGGIANPYYYVTQGHGVFIVRFADGTTGLRAFTNFDPTGSGWACDAPPRAGGLSHRELLEAVPRLRTKARAAKLRWCAGAGGERVLALFVGKYRGRKHATAAKRRTFKKIDERFAMEPIDAVRTVGLRQYALRHETARLAGHVQLLMDAASGHSPGPGLTPAVLERLAAALERAAPMS